MPDQIIERASFAHVRKPRAVHVACDEALLFHRATDALCNVFDKYTKVMWSGLQHLPEDCLPCLIDHVHASR